MDAPERILRARVDALGKDIAEIITLTRRMLDDSRHARTYAAQINATAKRLRAIHERITR